MKTETVFPINFSSTMLDDVWTCETLFFRKHCQRFIGNARNGHLIAGGHIAKACEITRKAYFNEGKDEDEAIDLGKTYILEAEDTTHELKSNERVAMCFEKYFKKYSMSSNLRPVALVNGEFAIEYLFEIDLGIPHPEIPGVNLKFKGKLDGLYQRPFGAGYKVAVLDEKTTSSIKRLEDRSIDYLREEQEWTTNSQTIGYHWAARKLGVKTDHTIIRRIPILKEFEPAYELDIPIRQFTIDNWERSVRTKILNLIVKYMDWKHSDETPLAFFETPYNNKHCNSYGTPCPFKMGCVHEMGEQEILMSFKQMVYYDGENLPIEQYKQVIGAK